MMRSKNSIVHEKKQTTAMSNLMRRHIALPPEHGAWVFLFSPLLIGGFAAGQWKVDFALLAAAALAGFLARQPLTIAVKVYSRRRPRTELAAARFWMLVYGIAGAAAALGLFWLGHAMVLRLAPAGLPVLLWYLWLISKRSERRQVWVEVAASGILALAAPAAYWVGRGEYDALGWLLWGLCWLQSAGSIIFVYLRLDQRRLPSLPDRRARWQMGRAALGVNCAALLLVGALAALNLAPAWLTLAYTLQLVESIWGVMRPALKANPTRIGIRQLVVSSLFTLIFILAW